MNNIVSPVVHSISFFFFFFLLLAHSPNERRECFHFFFLLISRAAICAVYNNVGCIVIVRRKKYIIITCPGDLLCLLAFRVFPIPLVFRQLIVAHERVYEFSDVDTIFRATVDLNLQFMLAYLPALLVLFFFVGLLIHSEQKFK